jgi:peptidylprolyl isomerase
MALARSLRRAGVALLLVSALVASGCGKSKTSAIPSGGSASGSAPASSTPTTTTPPVAKGPSRVPPGAGEKTLGKKPKIGKPSGAPPAALKIRDIVKGKGAVAKSGKTVSVQYVGIAYSNGQQFDASWDHGKPFDFTLGAGMVIPGWDKGVPGMKVGGRRQLIIPAPLAYGANGQPPTIGPNETLVFDIDLLKVK